MVVFFLSHKHYERKPKHRNKNSIFAVFFAIISPASNYRFVFSFSLQSLKSKTIIFSRSSTVLLFSFIYVYFFCFLVSFPHLSITNAEIYFPNYTTHLTRDAKILFLLFIILIAVVFLEISCHTHWISVWGISLL